MTFIRHSLVTIALATACAGALAHMPPGTDTDNTRTHAQRRADPAKQQDRFERRMASLKQKLDITPAQEGAWSAFRDAMTPQAHGARPDREALAGMTLPQRIDHHRAQRQERMAQMDRRDEAVKSLYGALSTQQQRTFDEGAGRRFQGHQRSHHDANPYHHDPRA